MRLNAQTDYALRIMMVLAAKGGEPATIREVALRLDLSRAHMMQIAAKLAAHGLVKTTRGRAGGLLLSREAHQVTVEDVVKAIEPDFALVQCMQPMTKSECPLDSACLLKGALGSALGAFFAELRSVSLADLVSPNRAEITQIFRLHMATPELATAKGGVD
ncbi:MAG: Rrf2 family transcriptional regulator [Fimbriimonadaceae bacterium]|nr:Rrf2 family transcriptional regulator [Fimbriimonadaceae bacterium]